MPKRDQVFVSHAHSDAVLAHRIADDLARAKRTIWIAPESIHPGEGWVDAINRGLEEASHLVLVLTPRAVQSQWVRQEVSAAVAMERRGRLQIIPVDVENCEIPPLWDAYQKVSLRDGYEAGIDKLRRAVGVTLHFAATGSTPPRATKAASGDLPASSQLNTYARLYDAVYERLTSADRNFILNAVFVDQLFELGGAMRFSENMLESLFRRGSDGDRMVALLLIQTAPAPGYLDVAVEAVSKPRSPFEQFQGLRAIHLMIHLLNARQRQTVAAVLAKARKRYLIPANVSRWQLYTDISAELSTSRAKRYPHRRKRRQ